MEGREKWKAALHEGCRAADLGLEKPLANEIDRAADQYLPPELRSLNTVQKAADWIRRTGGNHV